MKIVFLVITYQLILKIKNITVAGMMLQKEFILSKYRQNGFDKSLFSTSSSLWERVGDYALVLVLGVALAIGLFVYVS